MIHIVTAANRHLYRAQIDAMHGYRRQFAQTATGRARGEGAEGRDEFDDEAATYLMALTADGDIDCSMRARPSLGGTLLERYFPDLIDPREPPVSGPTVWETSRFMVARDGAANGVRRTPDLILAAMEHASRQGATRIVGVTTVANLERMQAACINTRPLGPSWAEPKGGLVAVAAETAITPEDIDAFRRAMNRAGWAGYEVDEEDMAVHGCLRAVEIAFDTAAATPVVAAVEPAEAAIAQAELSFRRLG